MPGFSATSTNYTLPEFVRRIRDRTLVINRTYQRSDKVWPLAAQQFLIESILLGFLIPKMTIRETTDLATRDITSEIIDGQQRTKAIVSFYNDEFALSRNCEIDDGKNRTYSELSDDLKAAFVAFKVQADIISGADDATIIELFRRINSNTVALNAEEQRHAKYQGPFKWFVLKLAGDFSPTLGRFEVLTPKQLARMQDTKLLSEILHAMLDGISTTSTAKLNALYGRYNQDFPAAEADALARRMKRAFEFLRGLEELIGTELCKPFQMYSLLLAIAHAQESIPSIEVLGRGGRGLRQRGAVIERLTNLAEVAASDEDPDDVFSEFWAAGEKATNTRENRSIRFLAFLDAVSPI